MAKKIKVIIVDDQIENIELLSYMLNKHIKDVEVVGFAKNLAKTIELIEDNEVDLLFLDIELSNGETGFDIISETEKYKIPTVFVTAFDSYGIEAVKNHVIDYLLKPIDIIELQKCIEFVRSKTNNFSEVNKLEETELVKSIAPNKMIAIPFVDQIKLLKQEDIMYLHSHGKYSTFVLGSGKEVMSSKNIGEYESMLDQNNFVRIHHSYIINLNFLDRIDKDAGMVCVLQNGAEIPISKRKKKELYTRFNY